MVDYEALDLAPFVNARDDLELPGVEVWRGEAALHGLPFVFAERDGQSLLLRIEPGELTTVPLASGAAHVRTITFAHRTRDSVPASFAPVGRINAVYVFEFTDGETVRVPIREGFEIAVGPGEWGARPSLAVPDRSDSLPEREHGRFADMGDRQTEVVEAGKWEGGYGWRYHLWSWVNPRPEQELVRIEVEGHDAVVEIGGVCLGFIDEHPLEPEPARVVVADTPADYVGDGSDLALEVDRGTVGYTTALVRQPEAGDPFAVWGDADDAEVAGVYARVSSVDSGTVRLLADGQTVAEAAWSGLRANGLSGVAGLRVTELGRNWVRTTIVDDATGEPVPCRVQFSSPDGVPYQPHGHHQHVNSDLPSWHVVSAPMCAWAAPPTPMSTDPARAGCRVARCALGWGAGSTISRSTPWCRSARTRGS